MVSLRNLVVNLKVHWSNLRHSVKPYLNFGSNRCLDLVMICTGIHPIPGPEPWKRHCQILYRLLGIYQLLMSLARVGFSIYNQDDMVALCASILIAVSMITCLLKVYALEHFQEVIRQSKTFVDSKYGHSSNPDFDASVRQDAARATGKVTVVIFLLLCCDQVIIMIPTTTRNCVYGIPKQFQILGPTVFRFLQEAYVFLIAILWGNRNFCYPLTVMPLLMGLRSELKIVAHGYETIQNRVQAQISEDHNNAVGSSRKQPSQVLRWMHLKQILGTTLEQHIEVLRNIQLVQNTVGVRYAITYYSSMLIISIAVLLVIRGGITFISLAFSATASTFIVECYFVSLLVESIEDIMELIAGCVAQMGTELEHSVEHHSEYVQMRTSLMIIQLNASQRGRFSCGGFFPITVESVGDLCFIVYRFATFLLNFD